MGMRDSTAASRTYVSFKGAKQGPFRGQNSKGGREAEGWFEIQSFSFGMNRPNHAKPLSIAKQSDAASPKLLEALNTKENLEIVIQTVDKDNKVIKTVTLKNALVTGIHKDDWERVYFEYTDILTQP